MNNTTEEINYDPPQWAKPLIETFGVFIVVAVSTLSVSNYVKQPGVGTAGNGLGPNSVDLCRHDSDGLLSGRLYGAVDMSIDWRGADMTCEGMRRPDGNGIRLLFASRQGREARLVFVIGVDGEVEQLTLKERVANITIIDEIDGRFFSTGGNDRCWTTINKVESIDGGDLSAYQIDGEVYCAGGLPSLTDNASVTLGDFRFSGRLAIDAS